jgi:hypothetical protein
VRGVLDTTLCNKVCQWLAADRWLSSGIPVSSTNKIDRHDIAEILLKVALNIITPYRCVGSAISTVYLLYSHFTEVVHRSSETMFYFYSPSLPLDSIQYNDHLHQIENFICITTDVISEAYTTGPLGFSGSCWIFCLMWGVLSTICLYFFAAIILSVIPL